jgi:PAS domain S-box-containing protein
MNVPRVPIKIKLTVIIVVSSTLALLIASFGFLTYDLSYFRSRMAADLETEAEVIGTNCGAAVSFNDRPAAEEVLRALHSRGSVEAAAVYRPDGTLFARYMAPKASSSLIPQTIPLGRAQRDSIVIQPGGISVFRVIRSEGSVLGTLYMRSSLREWRAQRNRFAAIMGLLALVSAILSAIVGLRLQRLVSVPIIELTDAMRAVAQDEQYSRRVARRTQDEIGELVDGFNVMLAEIEREIRDRTEAQEGLIRSQHDLQDFFDNATVGLHWLGPDGTILRANRTELEMLGYSAEEYVGHNILEFHRDKLVVQDILARLSSGEIITAYESIMVCRDGSTKPVAIEASVLWQGETFVHTRGFTRDLTAYKEAEQARLHQEQAERANRAKSEFLSRMSHELRTPMNAIMGFSQILAMDDLTDDQQDSLDRLMTAGKHLLKLINEVLDISRIESGHLSISREPVSVTEIVQEVLALSKPLADLKFVSIVNKVADHPETFVMADRQRMSQILINIVSNAIKYNIESGAVTIAAQAEGTMFRLTVTDTGPGIPADQVPLLFMPFQRLGAEQTAVEGTGLGMALSKSLVEAMAGNIGLLPVPHGTCFFVDLPLAQCPSLLLDDVSVDAAGDQSAEQVAATVLVVEDNLSNVKLMQKVLARRPGYRMILAMTGADAVVLARKNRPDIVLLDLNLPDIHGKEVLEQLRSQKETREIPVLVVSADASPTQIRRLKDVGAADYIAKPFEVNTLFSAIDACLHKEVRRSA